MEFHNIEIEDKALLESFTKQLKLESSEFTFTNLIIWGQEERIQIAVQDDVLYVRFHFPGHAPFMLAPIPRNINHMDYPRAIAMAEEHFQRDGLSPKFRSLSGILTTWFEQYCPQYQLIADRDVFDYVYSAQDLISLKGKRFHAKRNHINQFQSLYSFVYKPLSSDLYEPCMKVYAKWMQSKDINQPGILGERQAIAFLIPNMETLGVKGGAIYIKDQIVAFTLGEQIREDMALIHIEKADANIPGLYPLINQQFAAHEWSHVEWINREEDMGLDGLRKAKLSYNPARLIEKYTATLRANP